MWKLWLLAAMATGCFNPRFDATACSARGECPSGLVCGRSNICVTTLDDASPDTTLPIDAPPDMAIDMVDANPNLLSYDMVLRDFRGRDLYATGHVDFEQTYWMPTSGMVLPQLVSGKPALSANPHPSIATSDSFAQWYVDDAAVNVTHVDPIVLSRVNNAFTYVQPMFFPLDARGFAALGQENLRQGHNYSFTTESHITFTYQGAERIAFSGDDDVWIFVNGHLVIDLGGVHGPLSGQVILSATNASALDLLVGQPATISIFQAERHVTGSSYSLTLENLTP